MHVETTNGFGWLVMIVIEPMMANVAPGGLFLLLVGGLCYSLGVIFYVWKTLVYHHAIKLKSLLHRPAYLNE